MKPASTSTSWSFMTVLGLLALTQGLVNPIKMITQPANRVDIDLKLWVYTIKIQSQSILGIYKPLGCETTITYYKSSIVNTQNPFSRWNHDVFSQSRAMTKEEYMKTDFKFKESFRHFRVVKDPYDGFRMVPTPRVQYDKHNRTLKFVENVKAAIDFTLVHEVVVVDLSAATLKEASELGQDQLLLQELCAGIGKSKLKATYLCVYEVEGDQYYMPDFRFGEEGNYLIAKLDPSSLIGMHLDDANKMPVSARDDLILISQLSAIKNQMIDQIDKVLSIYSTQISSAYKDIKEEVWLSDNNQLVEQLNKLEYWRSKFEEDVSNLAISTVTKVTIPNLKKVFAELYESYQANSAKSVSRLDSFRSKPWPVQLILKYPAFIVLLIITILSFARFLKREKKDLHRVFSNNLAI